MLVIGVSALSYWYGIRIGERVAKLKVERKWNI